MEVPVQSLSREELNLLEVVEDVAGIAPASEELLQLLILGLGQAGQGSQGLLGVSAGQLLHYETSHAGLGLLHLQNNNYYSTLSGQACQ